jgi:hypothetical protein
MYKYSVQYCYIASPQARASSVMLVALSKYFASIYTHFKFQQFILYISNQILKSHRAWFRRKEIFLVKSSFELGKDDHPELRQIYNLIPSKRLWILWHCQASLPQCKNSIWLNKQFLNLNLQRKAIAARFMESIRDTRGLCLTMPVEIGDQNGLSIGLK